MYIMSKREVVEAYKNLHICMSLASCMLSEVPVLDVVIESDAVGAAKHGKDFQDLTLLFWRDHVLTVMDAIIRAVASTKG